MEVDLCTEAALFRAAVPSGASTGGKRAAEPPGLVVRTDRRVEFCWTNSPVCPMFLSQVVLIGMDFVTTGVLFHSNEAPSSWVPTATPFLVQSPRLSVPCDLFAGKQDDLLCTWSLRI